ncbi:hypothetical protein JB92DRAFT_2705719 [Gautieria morchelliformis]|nr:hypothetical protein JB92DRAFT_2705719 [Gautieria morchelliformis]
MTLHQQPLDELLQQLREILQSIPLLESQGYRPPIIDGDGYTQNRDPIIGLRIFKDSISREVEVLEQFLASSEHGSELSTNASYFVAVWNEILSAPPPIVAVGKVFEPPDGKSKKNTSGSATPGGIKVDVVADEGRKWIRVNTMKNSRILAEFREADSYLTGSEDDSDVDEPLSPPSAQENSLLRMGRALAAASTVPIAGTNEKPSVTLRLTRLQPEPPDGDTDPRIAETIHSLGCLGIDIQLGERTFRSLHRDGGITCSLCRSRPVEFRPTNRVNMDLSMLIALVSDLSHAELPKNEEGARTRFRMPVCARSWKLGKSSTTATSSRKTTGPDEDLEYSKHSRALSNQCMQEMEHGLIDEIVGRLTSAGDHVTQFWTTEEARDRCLQIVEKIGGEAEKRRAHALFPADLTMEVSRCRADFWRGSRYSQSFFPSLLPIHIHPSHTSGIPRSVSSLFWGHLIQTCRHILSYDVAPHPRLYKKDGEMERAKVTKLNTKLTVHTVESMLIGACEEMTTLTANKASVKALLREMKSVKHGCEDATAIKARPRGCAENGVEDSMTAAVWIVEPRSLAEGMRADHLQ